MINSYSLRGVWLLPQCARSTYRDLGLLLLHLQSVYNVSGQSDSPNSALTGPYGLVSPFARSDPTDSSRLSPVFVNDVVGSRAW